MLEESEYAALRLQHGRALEAVKGFRERTGAPLDHPRIRELWKPVHTLFAQFTGVDDLGIDEMMHHRLAAYGPACHECGKPLRTPEAQMCAACGVRRGGVAGAT
jgi:hypothetical protein